MSSVVDKLKSNDKEIIYNYVTKKQTSQPYGCQWIPSSCSVITVGKKATTKGDIKIHQLEFEDTTQDPKLNLIYENETISPLRCMSFFKVPIEAQQRKFATGDFNGGIAVWDSDICDIPIWSIKEAHKGCIAAIDAYGDSMVVCGGKDGTVKIFDTRINPTNHGGIIASFEQDIKNNCWSICTNDNVTLCGFENGDLKIYNLKTNTLQTTTNIGSGGICSIDSNNRKECILDQILITTNKSFISLISIKDDATSSSITSRNDYQVNNNPNQTIWSGIYSPFNNNKDSNENVYSIAQGDGTVSMYRDQNILIDKVTVSDSPILSLDYSKDRKGLLCCLSLKKQLSILISPY